MPDTVIKKMEKLADNDRAEDGINFRNRKKDHLIRKRKNTRVPWHRGI